MNSQLNAFKYFFVNKAKELKKSRVDQDEVGKFRPCQMGGGWGDDSVARW